MQTLMRTLGLLLVTSGNHAIAARVLFADSIRAESVGLKSVACRRPLLSRVNTYEPVKSELILRVHPLRAFFSSEWEQKFFEGLKTANKKIPGVVKCSNMYFIKGGRHIFSQDGFPFDPQSGYSLRRLLGAFSDDLLIPIYDFAAAHLNALNSIPQELRTHEEEMGFTIDEARLAFAHPFFGKISQQDVTPHLDPYYSVVAINKCVR